MTMPAFANAAKDVMMARAKEVFMLRDGMNMVDGSSFERLRNGSTPENWKFESAAPRSGEMKILESR